MKNVCVLAVVLFAVYGCGAIPSVEKGSPDGQVSLSFDPVEDKGVMYLYRDRESHFGLFILDIYIGDDTVETSPACFVRIELAPGTYFVEADHPDTFGIEDEMTFEAKEGQVAFYEYKPIARPVVPGETKIIPRSREEAISKIESQELCISPVERLSR